MRISNSSYNQMEFFANSPNSYILSAQVYDDEVLIKATKKSILIWVKLKGRKLLCLNQSPYKMRTIDSILSRVNTIEIAGDKQKCFEDFKKSFSTKRSKFEAKNYKLFHSSEMTTNDTHVQSLADNRLSTVKKSQQIINNLKETKFFTSVNVRSINTMPNPNKTTHEIQLQISGLHHSYRRTSKKAFIDSKQIMEKIITGNVDGNWEKEMKKVAQRGYKRITIHVTQADDKTVAAKIFAQ